MYEVTTCRGEMTAPLPPAEALVLFTPEAEVKWMGGYEPRFVSDRRDGEGVVYFNHDQVYVMAWRDETRVRYVRVVPEEYAALIDVEALATSDESTAVKIWMEVTPIGEKGVEFASSLSADWDDTVARWQGYLDRYLATSG